MKWVTTILVFCVCALFGVGIVMLYSASTTLDGTKYLLKQLVWGGVGVVGCVVLACSDYRKFKKLSPYLLAAAVVLLAVVFIPHVGILRGGSHRWVGTDSLSFQVSEIAKLATIIFLAFYCEYYQRWMRSFWRGLVLPCALIGLVCGLIFIEPDWGSTILLGSVCLGMLFIAGVRVWQMILSALAAMAGLTYFLLNNANRMGRVRAWHDPAANPAKAFQNLEGLIALGAGGLWGLGLGNGRQKLGFIPVQNTDFIFTIIGEELGFIATLSIVLTFVILVICAVIIARRAADPFGMLLAAGIAFLIGLQACMNIAVVTATIPNKGIPLPFISYGGSNLLLMFACVGILLSISRFAGEGPRSADDPMESESDAVSNA